MTDVLAFGCDLILFLVTIAIVGRYPTFLKVCLMTAVVAGVHIFIDAQYAASQGMNIYSWYLSSYNDALETMGSMFSAGDVEASASLAPMVAGCWFAVYVIQAAGYVFLGLCLVWLFKLARKQPSKWAPFTKVDVPIEVIGLLIIGILLTVVARFEGFPHADIVRLVGLNAIAIAVIPLFVQGAAIVKYAMNRFGANALVEILVVVILVLFGFAFLIFPIAGLIDMWANLRALPRDGERAK